MFLNIGTKAKLDSLLKKRVRRAFKLIKAKARKVVKKSIHPSFYYLADKISQIETVRIINKVETPLMQTPARIHDVSNAATLCVGKHIGDIVCTLVKSKKPDFDGKAGVMAATDAMKKTILELPTHLEDALNVMRAILKEPQTDKAREAYMSYKSSGTTCLQPSCNLDMSLLFAATIAPQLPRGDLFKRIQVFFGETRDPDTCEERVKLLLEMDNCLCNLNAKQYSADRKLECLILNEAKTQEIRKLLRRLSANVLGLGFRRGLYSTMDYKLPEVFAEILWVTYGHNLAIHTGVLVRPFKKLLLRHAVGAQS